jgi:hypothetical protein
MQKIFCTLGLLLSLLSIQSHASQAFSIKESAVFAPQRLGQIKLRYDEQGYSVIQNGKSHKIESYDVDPLLRKMNREQLKKFQQKGLISVNQADNGEFSLKAGAKLRGGGPGGATIGAYVGKFLVHFVAHGTILIVGACTGPAAPATIASLEATFLPTIEAASNVGAIAGGIIGGVATGPV